MVYSWKESLNLYLIIMVIIIVNYEALCDPELSYALASVIVAKSKKESTRCALILRFVEHSSGHVKVKIW